MKKQLLFSTARWIATPSARRQTITGLEGKPLMTMEVSNPPLALQLEVMAANISVNN